MANSAPTDWDRTTWYSTRNCGIKDCRTYDFVAGRVDQANSKDYSAGCQFSIIVARYILKIAKMANSSRQMPKICTTRYTSPPDDPQCPQGSSSAQGPPSFQPLQGTACPDLAQDPSCQLQDSAWPSAVRRCSRLMVDVSSICMHGRAEGLTVVAAENKVVHWLQTKESEEVPGQTRHPSHIEVTRSHSRLEHSFELRSQWEREFHCQARSAVIHFNTRQQRVSAPQRECTVH